MAKDETTTPPGEVIINESHYHSKKDRIFVRALQGHYNLREELARLRAACEHAHRRGSAGHHGLVLEVDLELGALVLAAFHPVQLHRVERSLHLARRPGELPDEGSLGPGVVAQVDGGVGEVARHARELEPAHLGERLVVVERDIVVL